MKKSRPLRLREMAARRSVAAIGAVVVVARRAEVTEEMVERAVLRNIGHSRHSLRVVVIDLVGVAELDLDRNDGRLHAVDDVGERSRASRGLRARAGGVDGRDRGFERDAAKGRQRHSAEKRRTEGIGGSIKRHQGLRASQSVLRRLSPPPHDRENALARLNTRCREHESLVMWFIVQIGSGFPEPAREDRGRPQ